ncbi:PIN domain-containing protein [Halocatena salina]|uniref:Twitching motility protein PilT n=1 Tax=Halocatena salina TaxID=2934340 RepID=A0A8T9ZZG3_9EURY|nr:twitching motility protein PilT [Halocatena salina]UPM42180.1 twitching motility protein PilT [Halocatena salina]
MDRVAMDTNALMMPVESDVRVFEQLDRLLGEYELITPRAVIDELDSLASGHGTEATAATVGRDLAERCAVVDTEASYADDALVELADRGACEYVVTNDGPLRDRLSVGAICLRGQNKLDIQ